MRKKIYAWFEKLPSRVQCLVRQNVQKWSVSALRQLTKVSNDLIEELVGAHNETAKTAAQVRKEGGIKTKNSLTQSVSLSHTKELTHLPVKQLAPGVRVVVMGDNAGWNGQSGIIMSQNEDSFWVLLDCVVAQGQEVKNVFKPNQLKLETKRIVNSVASKNLFTEQEVEEKIAYALSKHDKEKTESELGRFVEIRDAALRDAKEEILAAEQYAKKMAQAKNELVEQLAAKEQEIQQLQSLRIKNQQLEQRVNELSKALEQSSQNQWGNTFNKQAAKVLNSNLEKTIPTLMSEVERLKDIVQSKDQELAQIKAISFKQQEDLEALQQTTAPMKCEEVITTFGEVGERLGWNGWGRRGYRSNNGMLYTGLDAITAFVSDLTHSDNFSPEFAF